MAPAGGAPPGAAGDRRLAVGVQLVSVPLSLTTMFASSMRADEASAVNHESP
ncbi:hypothetical protein [Sorangium sp. So ce406]|uniref:hypothetical protein n=1 Tax=Sorangium sp. So ce406 TaxID=3133311 RepID=UPI003F5C2A42